MTISSANIQFNEQGTPVAVDFDDVYFSNVDGLAETNYVFLKNNGLPERWLNCESPQFVIAETGFGTGLNFLATVAAYRHLKKAHPNHTLPQLYYISTEKYPLTKKSLEEALARWSDFSDISLQLLQQYPSFLPGCHRMSFDDDAIVLDLWLGDVHDTLPQLSVNQHGLVNAWFLDGFAPSKNPQMWSDTLFENMARLTAPFGTFATFTAAGFVKRGLAAVGFNVEKRKGFGRKRDMLAGTMPEGQSRKNIEKAFYRHAANGNLQQANIAIVGAGLAGANVAYALARKGLASTVFGKQNEVADAASGNTQGGFYPQLGTTFSIASALQAHGFVYAKRLYQQLLQQHAHFPHQWCGVLLPAYTEDVREKYSKLIGNHTWPIDLVRRVAPPEAQDIAGIDMPYCGLFIEQGGWLSPKGLVSVLMSEAKRKVGTAFSGNATLVNLARDGQQWKLQWQHGEETRADIVILATGAESLNLPVFSELPLGITRGQVEFIPTSETLSGLNTVLCHKGYMTPKYDERHALGSTYFKGDPHCQYRYEEQQHNIATHQTAMAKCDWVDALKGDATGRAATRCNVPDHIPLMGSLFDAEEQRNQYQTIHKTGFKSHNHSRFGMAKSLENLYTLTALGSRGLTTAPLLAEALVSQITASPIPLPVNVLNALSPNRFLIRALSKNEAQ
ncbi:bifunctional tRNA (5-methylaminomethyl-2-thiouridine)(34)-methyltransferase MnmD/FAD-dependent 5-carboxymethylaminomethyl-2-thiouridine(34) oxidoreductase MnmC [Aestuariibacter sp. AA17]|uniref:tRNA 5-methylaminomethyl-2-thiouridine biosynthesis bifunctional protein MnmC n=1 Tax=Fluctibacter corallii TaxID=2984329 RepID=A0ABT3A315_9ALTE|nr:bifunctional tRNA (5-methylaminomethyl-2-thiouridine)(34)-methyltransferase MnmD/FAD-dependent 5-carboxymethylaminomethyl-2-thiouridine(34) oxidoreductase MnmC [Aestuariibacter sp. AA17]MCV2883083.1 bifunctional tRNA (5-methylaminomethyl-2-thiouridine)(34)-methyltransferase MnmD/FAD-dependent 5-carboxymethylaminomethyl-2-thiouridine(34) oxidoreductase MnmC [Aestuariibacter sp. AA17]